VLPGNGFSKPCADGNVEVLLVELKDVREELSVLVRRDNWALLLLSLPAACEPPAAVSPFFLSADSRRYEYKLLEMQSKTSQT
jgi:hypothetical protein